jgi:hypothetical protein
MWNRKQTHRVNTTQTPLSITCHRVSEAGYTEQNGGERFSFSVLAYEGRGEYRQMPESGQVSAHFPDITTSLMGGNDNIYDSWDNSNTDNKLVSIT